MRKEQIAAQLYSFREHITTRDDLIRTLGRLKRIGYDAVQLSGAIAPMPESELAAILAGEGLAAPTAHEGSAAILERTAEVIARLKRLGCPHVAYPWPHRPLASHADAVALARDLDRAAREMAAEGITLAYHNHDLEFRRCDGRIVLDTIYAEAPALQGEIDTFWVQAGGGSPLEWIRRMYRRMDVIHLKDYGQAIDAQGRRMMPLGAGTLDWPALLSAAADAGVGTYVVEHDGDCPDPFASFAASLDHLRTHFIR